MFAFIQITKEDVDSFETSEQGIPSCQLTAKWAKQDKQPSQLTYQVTLVGAKAPDNYFSIVLDSTLPDTTKVASGKLLVHKPYIGWLLSAISLFSIFEKSTLLCMVQFYLVVYLQGIIILLPGILQSKKML